MRTVLARAGGAALVAAGLIAVAGCGASSPGGTDADDAATTATPLSAGAAPAHYARVERALADALASRYHLTWTTKTPAQTESCRYVGARLVSRAWLGKDGDWKGPIAVADKALKGSGFDTIKGEDDIKGGFTGFSTRDSHGARVRVFAKGTTTLELETPLAGSGCG